MPSVVWTAKAGRYCAGLLADDEVGDQLRSLLVDLHTSDVIGPVGTIEVFRDGPAGYVIRSDGRVWNDSVHRYDVPDQVVHMLLRAALDEEKSLVHIHAGAVALGDRTAILAGWPGSGKSTAIIALLREGFSYVTDERLTLSQDGRSVTGFPKPISLITGSFDALEDLDPRRTGYGAANADTWQIPASSIGAVAPQDYRSATVLVFVAYRPNAAFRASRVSPCDAAARLLGDSPDVTARGRDGANAIVALVSSIPCVEIEYSESDELVAEVRDLLDNPPNVIGDDPVMLTGNAPTDRQAPLSPDDIETGGSYSIAADSTAWVIDDDAIAYVQESGVVVELDPTTAVWMQLLHEGDSVDELIDEVASVTETDATTVRSTAQHAVHRLWSTGVIGPMSSS